MPGTLLRSLAKRVEQERRLRVFSSVAQLWRHEAFRRLLLLRIVTQTADGCVQVGLASYVLFSPYQQPSGGAIAAVLA